MKKSFWNVKTPFFKPVWRRALACVVCLIWAGVELSYGNKTFGALFLAAGGYLVHQFFIVYNPADYTQPPPDA
ncbi:hypothetical protein EDD53_0978 [Pacificibacter maritimus]|uniref:DUF3329 domain-containing protein n=1 Tax=Pacificibacter maritimus TaxID=762213 RepID=A0A3N4UP88_9RHOB|nr:DUF3329 domain-containing protein [Pacificibacter maritimus]RPE71848.1 hypothetical protein EDD53_0978 [Pacificibacter maritimus]